MIRIVCSLFVATALAFQASASVQIEAPSEPSLQKQLADRFVRALTELPYLRLKAVVTEEADIVQADGPNKQFRESITIVSEMAPGRLRSFVFTDDGALDVLIAFDGERMHEYRPSFDFGKGHRLSDAVLSYEAEFTYGAEDVYLKPPERCMYGSYLHTWLGDGARMSYHLGLKIARSESVDEIEHEGTAAYQFTRIRVMSDPTTGEEERNHETLIVERDTMIPRALTTVQSGSQGTITRSRTFLVLDAGSVPADQRWAVDTKSDGEATLESLTGERKEVDNDVVTHNSN